MNKFEYKQLKSHVGHDIQCVEYGNHNATIECWTCNEVILSMDEYGGSDEED